MKKIKFLAILGTAFLLMLSALVACGGTSTPSTSSSTTPAAPKNLVTMSGVTFATNTITIAKGDTITFETLASSGSSHNLVNGTEGAPHPEVGSPVFGTGGQTLGPGKS
jgi:plastocyanin